MSLKKIKDILSETAMLDKYLSTKGVNPKYATMQVKVAHSKTNAFKKWQKDHYDSIKKQELQKQGSLQLNGEAVEQIDEISKETVKSYKDKVDSKIDTLGKMSDRYQGRHDDRGRSIMYHIQKNRAKAQHAKGMAAADKRLSSEEVEADYGGQHQANVLALKAKAEKKPVDMKSLAARMQASYKKDEKKPEIKEARNYDDNRTGFRKKPREDDEYHNETEPKQRSMMDRPHTVHIGNKPWKKFENGHQAHAAAKTLQSKGKDAVAIAHMKEETEQLDESRKKEMSKSARMIKALYKKHKMVKEAEDKEKPYGKAPKHNKADPEKAQGDEKPTAAAVLTGGTTLTGEKRDDIEIDPMMRARPGQPDPSKKKDEDDKKNDK